MTNPGEIGDTGGTGGDSIGDVRLIHGACEDVLAGLPAESVSAIVTDPPYGIRMMNRKWDYDVPTVAQWEACLRVLKPGGHLLSFAGTRTQHRMAVRIEDAGFEIRDMIAWVYGSGWPKSLDVSKAMDRIRDWSKLEALNSEIRRARQASGLTLRQIGEAMQEYTDGQYGNWYHRGGHMFFETGRSLPSRPEWDRLRDVLPIDPGYLEVYEQAEREITGHSRNGIAGGTGRHAGSEDVYGYRKEYEITAPATDAARRWSGFGTALKPAFEPITVARKPIPGTIADNVLRYGTGALNIDGCRVPSDAPIQASAGGVGGYGGSDIPYRAGDGRNYRDGGRWPANLIHDGSEEVVGLFPQTTTNPGTLRSSVPPSENIGYSPSRDPGTVLSLGNSGSAARFFKSCTTGDEEWLIRHLGMSPASIAASDSSLPSEHVAIAVGRAANLGLPEGMRSSVRKVPSTTVTVRELRKIAESVTEAIRSIVPRFLQEWRQTKLSPKNSPASVVADREPTGITTITVSHWRSDGSADPVIFSIMPENSDHGVPASGVSQPRFIYCAKASRADRGPSNDWPTVKPTDLMRYLVRLVTPPGGLVLDPWMGSGSTGKAAVLEGFRFLGIDKDAHAFEIAGERVEGAKLSRHEGAGDGTAEHEDAPEDVPALPVPPPTARRPRPKSSRRDDAPMFAFIEEAHP